MDYNVREFGAVGDGITKDTEAIQKAIDVCSQKGGRVVLSEGTFLTGTLFMKSNVDLHLEVNAALVGSSDISDYSLNTYKQLYRDESYMDRCLIFSYNAENISFTGRGSIRGQGDLFKESSENGEKAQRPMLLRYLNCRNIRLYGLKLYDPASWTNAFICCSEIWVDGIHIHSRANLNGDGLDFDCCQKVMISNCILDCSDDCICLQNSVEGKKCSDIVISNILMYSRWAGIRIGPLSCGDIENVTVTNCIFKDIECSAIKIQSAEGGSFKNMIFSNLVMENVQRPLFLTLNQFRFNVDMVDKALKSGELKNIAFNNIQAIGRPDSPLYLRGCMIIDGLPGYRLENISLSNIRYKAVGGGGKEDAERTGIPHHDGKRAECCNYNGSLPAYGLYARHVKGLRLDNIYIDKMEADERIMVYKEDCE